MEDKIPGIHSGLVRNNEIVLRPVRRTILDLKGTVKPHGRPEDFDRVRETVKQGQATKIAKGELVPVLGLTNR